MVAVVTLTDIASARYAITLSTADVISPHEVLGILFSADQNTVTQWWTELTRGSDRDAGSSTEDGDRPDIGPDDGDFDEALSAATATRIF